MTAPNVRTPGGNPANAETENDDAAILAAADVDGKRFAILRARLALAGYMLTPLAGGAWLIAKWDRTHVSVDVGELEAFADRAGVR